MTVTTNEKCGLVCGRAGMGAESCATPAGSLMGSAARPLLGSGARGFDERGEQASCGLRVHDQLLRMPLHAEHESRRVGELDALDDLVRCPGHRDEPGAERLQRLVVHAVDLELVSAERLREAASRFHLYLVRGLVPRLLLAVLDLRARLARHVLVERA